MFDQFHSNCHCSSLQLRFITRAEFLGEKDKAVAQEERVERAFSYMDVNRSSNMVTPTITGGPPVTVMRRHSVIVTAVLRDGYITKKEMLNLTKRLSQAQVSFVIFYKLIFNMLDKNIMN